MVDFGVRVGGGSSLKEIVEFSKFVVRHGFNYAWLNESALQWQDPFVSMALCANANSGAKVGLAVSNPVTRHPAVIARGISSVSEISGGAVLVMGTGDSAVRLLGLNPSTYSYLKKSVLLIRELLGGREVEFGGRYWKLKFASKAPVLIAGSGTKALELAGEVADGAMIMRRASIQRIREGIESIKRGADRSGRLFDDLYIIANVTASVDRGSTRAVDLVRPFAAGEILRETDPKKFEELEKQLYPDLIHAEDWEKAMELCRFLPESIIEENYLVGDPASWYERIRSLESIGVDQIFVRHEASYSFPEAVVKAFAKDVIPRFNRT